MNESSNYKIIECVFSLSAPCHPLMLLVCYLQLMIIVGLCLDSGKSWTGQFFKTKIMQFFGRISMSLYLIHEPLINWLKLIIHGPIEWEDGKNPGLKMPVWAIPIHLVISIIFGALLTLFIEEPARNILKNFWNKIRTRHQLPKEDATKV